MSHTDEQVEKALADYVRNDMTTRQIGEKHGVSPSTLTVWAENAGIELRPRGRRRLEVPTERQRQILAMCAHSTQQQVGDHFGMKKQSIQRICKRWASYCEPKRAPFSPGDVIVWKGQRLTVLAATPEVGTLEDAKGKLLFQFRWNQRGRLPKKVKAKHETELVA